MGRRWRAASGMSGPRLAACALIGLLPLVSTGASVAQARTAVPSARARGAPAAIDAATSRAGAATMATATPLKSGVRYGGVIAGAQQAWYKLEAAGTRAYVEVRGRTPNCSVRAALLDAHGRTVAQIISSTRENLPLIVYLHDQGEKVETYFLRIDANPYAPCTSAEYIFDLLEPDQADNCEPEPIAAAPGTPLTAVCPAGESAPSRSRQRECAVDQLALERESLALARERALVARRKSSINTLRAYEGRKNAARRRARAVCLG